jgi:hypothetical protein
MKQAKYPRYDDAMLAVCVGDIAIVRTLTAEPDFNLDLQDPRGNTMLSRAVGNMDMAMVSELVRLGANVNVVNGYTGDTELMRVSRSFLDRPEHPVKLYCKDNLAAMVAHLVSLGADPKRRARDGRTATRAVRAAEARLGRRVVRPAVTRDI